MTAPTVADPNLDWRLYALCGDDIDLWFPEGHPASKDVISQYMQARAVCQRCPVRDDCLRLTLAMESGDAQHRNGMAAGYTPHQRADPDLMRRAIDALERGDDPPGQDPMPAGHQPCGGCGIPVAPLPTRREGTVWWCTAPRCVQLRRQRRNRAMLGPASKPCAAGCGTDVPRAGGRLPGDDWWCTAKACISAQKRRQFERARVRAGQPAIPDAPASKPCAGCQRDVPRTSGRHACDDWWCAAEECRREMRRRAKARSKANTAARAAETAGDRAVRAARIAEWKTVDVDAA